MQPSRAGVRCGPICLATPGFEYVAAAMQRTFIDPFKYVGPEPLIR
jgi:hypothetical protein